jgi:hypothetical protein
VISSGGEMESTPFPLFSCGNERKGAEILERVANGLFYFFRDVVS